MSLLNHIRGLAIAALLTSASPAYLHAQSWETVDAFQLPGLDWCQALNLAVDSSGRLFVAGRGFASGASRGSVAVRRSNDQGLTWQTVFTLEDQSHSIFDMFKVFPGAPGKMFITTGGWQEGPDVMHWLVYRSDDGGDSWTNVDDFSLSPGYAASTRAATADSLGNVYVWGGAGAPGGQGKLVMRRSTDSGQTWTTLDLPAGMWPVAVATTPHGLFAVGQTDYVWKVWRSTNNGVTWSTVDTFSLGSGTTARGITADASGNLFVVGDARYDSAPTRWIVRRSTNGGANWTTVDNYLAAAGNHATAHAVTVDNSGRLWVAGWELGSWLVRRSDDLGANWVNSDVFLIPGRTPVAYGLATDVAGNVFAAGYGATPENEVHAEFWMVRKLAAPSRLAVEAANGSLRLTWPTSATSFVLQSATTLASGGDWQDSNLTPAVVGGQNVITVGTTNAAAFFRLRKP